MLYVNVDEPLMKQWNLIPAKMCKMFLEIFSTMVNEC